MFVFCRKLIYETGAQLGDTAVIALGNIDRFFSCLNARNSNVFEKR